MTKDEETLRDRFAMAALTGLLTNGGIIDELRMAKEHASNAYLIADAMMKERGKGNG